MRVNVSCSTKFWAFNLAEQLGKKQCLNKFYTMYFSQKDILYKKFHSRTDRENIPVSNVKTYPLYLPFFYISKDLHARADKFDRIVSRSSAKNEYDCFIGWSGMSLHTLKEVKKKGKIFILERGSSHILFQNRILQEEYAISGYKFEIDERIIKKELEEYNLADKIVVPSKFVYNSFAQEGFDTSKLFINNFGISQHFTKTPKNDSKFRILYLGGLSVRKGLEYLFRALHILDIPTEDYEVLFVGSINSEIQKIVPDYQKNNWKFLGHKNHYELAEIISQCDVAVHPSIEEGLSMVIPQMMGCGVAVIATTNTGGEDVITDGENGFIVPIRDENAIADKIKWYYNNPGSLQMHKKNAEAKAQNNLSWDDYGNRYHAFIKSIVTS